MALGLFVTGCASLPSEVNRPASSSLQDGASTRLGRFVSSKALAAGTRNDTGFALIGSAELAFTSRMALIKAAEKTLDLQYYAIHEDDTTRRLLVAIKEAAGRGVRVRILLDDFNTAGKNAQVLKLAFEKNIEMRLFNPLPSGRASPLLRIVSSLRDAARLQRRMHNKIFVADNSIAITGGRNLGETYFGQSDGANFLDLDILAAGRIARDLSTSFDQYWNNPLAYPVPTLMSAQEIDAIKVMPTVEALSAVAGDLSNEITAKPTNQASAESKPPSRPLVPLPAMPALPALPSSPQSAVSALNDDADLRLLNWTWAPATLLVDKPSKIAADVDAVEASQDTAVDGLLQLLRQAQKEVLIVSAYFVPGAQMMAVFADMRARGVRVRVLTNSLASNDAPAAHAGYARYRKALLGLGVEMFEMRALQLGSVSSLGSIGGSSLTNRKGLSGLKDNTTGSTGGSISGSSTGASRASLHAKVVVIDGRLLVVGSMNLDLRSQLQNSEVAVVINSQRLALETTQLIEPGLSLGAYRVQMDNDGLIWKPPTNSGLPDTRVEPDATFSLRLLLKLIAPFAPDEML